jgi:hypothetical protein
VTLNAPATYNYFQQSLWLFLRLEEEYHVDLPAHAM